MSARTKRLLTNVEISESRPGFILRDFQTFLEFIGPDGLKTSGKHSLLPMSSLRELDERMTNPQRPALKRPQQRSYPYLNGLYLILRATGLGVAEGIGAKGRLVLEPEVLSQWQSLNPTERYFNLLEAWLLFASPGMWGGHEGSWRTSFLTNVYRLYQRLIHYIEAGTDNPEFKQMGVDDQAHLALMELFGLARLGRELPCPGENWRLDAVLISDFGRGFFQFVDEYICSAKWIRELDDLHAFGVWQPELSQYFPEWQNSLQAAELDFRDGVYHFEVSLGRVWRRIAIPASCDFEDLADVILDAFNFDDDHLYRFTLRDRNGTKLVIDHRACDGQTFADEIAIGLAPIREGESFPLLYDFGDSWRFQVTLQKIDPPNPKIKQPKVVESKGKAPAQYDWDDDEDEDW